MTLKEIVSKLSELESGFKSLFTAKADDSAVVELKNQLSTIQATVTEKLAAAESQLTELKSTNETLSAAATAINTSLNNAIAALKLETKADASAAEKIEALQNGVSATIAKLNVKATEIPVAKVSDETKTKTRAQFSALAPAAQMAFIKAGGKITE